MKKILINMATLLAASSSFATTITCMVGEPNSEGIQKVISSEALRNSVDSATLLEKGNTKYLLTISDIFDKKDRSKIIAEDAMVLTTIVNDSAAQHMVSDGMNLMYLDQNNSIGVVCQRTK